MLCTIKGIQRSWLVNLRSNGSTSFFGLTEAKILRRVQQRFFLLQFSLSFVFCRSDIFLRFLLFFFFYFLSRHGLIVRRDPCFASSSSTKGTEKKKKREKKKRKAHAKDDLSPRGNSPSSAFCLSSFFSPPYTVGHDAGPRHGSTPLPEVWQDLSICPHVAHPPGRQAHGLPRLPLRALRHRGQVQELPALAHVSAASRDQHQGPASAADAEPVRPRTGLASSGEGGRQGEPRGVACTRQPDGAEKRRHEAGDTTGWRALGGWQQHLRRRRPGRSDLAAESQVWITDAQQQHRHHESERRRLRQQQQQQQQQYQEFHGDGDSGEVDGHDARQSRAEHGAPPPAGPPSSEPPQRERYGIGDPRHVSAVHRGEFRIGNDGTEPRASRRGGGCTRGQNGSDEHDG